MTLTRILRTACLTLISVFAMTAFSGCSTLGAIYDGPDIVSPAPSGASIEQKAYAYARAYDAALVEIGDVIAEPSTPDEVANALGVSARVTEPAVQSMLTAFREYGVVRAEITVRQDTGLPVSAALLSSSTTLLLSAHRAYQETRPEIEQFLALVYSAQPK